MNTTVGNTFLSQADVRILELAVKYFSVLRRVLLFDQLTAGRQPIYDMDPNAYAYAVPYQSAGPVRMSAEEEGRVWVRTFNLIGYKEFPLSEEYVKGAQITKAAKENLRSVVNELEDKMLFAAFERVIADISYPHIPLDISTGGPPPVYQPVGYDNMITATSAVENYSNLGFIIGRAAALNPLRIFGADIYSPITRDEILKSGIIATLWGGQVLRTRIAPVHTIYVTCVAENLGRTPELMGMTPMQNINPKNGKMEIGLMENIGICVFSPPGLFKIVGTT